jgi:hypothetical protein
LQSSKRRAVAARAIANSELGSGDLVGLNRRAVVNQKHFLIANADDHLVAGVPAE